MSQDQELVVTSYEDFFAPRDGAPIIWKTSVYQSGEDGPAVDCWHARHPGECQIQHLLGPKPPAAGHYVEEHEDGHITVRPNPPAEPGNSNSILCPMCGWHGYIDHGRWYVVGG